MSADVLLELAIVTAVGCPCATSMAKLGPDKKEDLRLILLPSSCSIICEGKSIDDIKKNSQDQYVKDFIG